MGYENAFIDQDLIPVISELKEKTYFETNMPFLLVHNGYRPKNIHMIMGTAGGGKSTLVRTCMIDILAKNKNAKIGVVLSEETRDELIGEFLDAIGKIPDSFKRLFILEELFSDSETTEDLLKEISLFVEQEGIDILFYDNITTSEIYEHCTPRQQYSFIKIE